MSLGVSIGAIDSTIFQNQAKTDAPRAQSSSVLYSAGLCARPSMPGTKSIAAATRLPIVWPGDSSVFLTIKSGR